MAEILIASPHEAERNRFVSALAEDGHSFLMCPDGPSVCENLKTNFPDLVMTHLDLPGLDAFEVVQMLEDVTEGKGIPLIVVDSDGFLETEEISKEGVPFTWMGLSTSPEDLREMVRARLATGRAREIRGKILVTDDDWQMRDVLSRRLGMEGYAVLTAQDGEEGLARLAEMPDLVLVDVSMPRLDGFGFLERMRAEADYQEIPVIVMTAEARDAEDAARGLELGASDYVRKPFDWRELFARVQTHLRIRESFQLSAEKQRDLAIIELAGAAAHEINNPLAVVMARLELLLTRMSPSNPLYEDLGKISGLVDRIADVVQKMSQVRHYQVRHYCGDVNILDLDSASAPKE